MGFAGGFTLGMVQAGFELVAKKEMPGGFGVANCEANRHLLGDGWQAQVSEPEDWAPHEAEVVFGNPPCSGFSVMSAKQFRGADSPINHCMWAFANYVTRALPPVAVFESVQMARTRPDGLDLMRRLRNYVEQFSGRRWDLYHVRHNALSLGGCSMRRRYFFVLSQVPFGVEIPRVRSTPTLNEAIGDLASLSLTWHQQPYRSPASHWATPRRSVTGSVDGHTAISNPLTTRIADLMSAVGWRPGESISEVCRRYHERHGRLPDSFRATADKIVLNNFNMGFTTPIRWNGDNPARVITSGSLLTGIHPTEERTLTHREAARIMGFPDDWRLWPLRNQSGLLMTHGKGITVDCGRWIGRWVRAAVQGEPGSHTGEVIGDREYDIDVTHSHRLPYLVG